nr:hypothetical protein [Sphingobium sp. BS19]
MKVAIVSPVRRTIARACSSAVSVIFWRSDCGRERNLTSAPRCIVLIPIKASTYLWIWTGVNVSVPTASPDMAARVDIVAPTDDDADTRIPAAKMIMNLSELGQWPMQRYF